MSGLDGVHPQRLVNSTVMNFLRGVLAALVMSAFVTVLTHGSARVSNSSRPRPAHAGGPQELQAGDRRAA